MLCQVTEMLRHASLSSVANLLSKVRSHANETPAVSFRYQGILVNQLVAWKREGSFVEAGYCRKIWGKRGADSGSVEGGYGVGMWKLPLVASEVFAKDNLLLNLISLAIDLLSEFAFCFCLSISSCYLHEIRAIAALEYLSSMVGSLEPMNLSLNGQRGDLEKLSLLEQNSRKGKFHVRFKRRNGRVRCEDFHIKQSGINFTPVSSEEGIINQGLLPKVQFNLQLSEKERIDRAKVVLPFEHQGNGEPMHIYDGRRSLSEGKDEKASVLSENLQTNENSGKGEIIYFRDSDDEMPDSDEDPDDDLDI
ncbi:Elongator complex protein 5 [Vitis vinifera]|uniref:Elongator complex protein 5 n=1 Tax=Vitis vinifera TaxID=29760 RepID=A0A438DAA0_VITVI|nr:Elongator complex protein 5 [Vitis vinifera]